MRRVGVLLMAAVLMMAFCATAWAGKKEDAKAMVDAALAMYAKDGKDATFKAINDPNGPFRKGELYVFVGDLKTRVNVLHPINHKLEGRDFGGLKDRKGNLFFMEFINTAKKGEGWVDYWWPKPGEKKASEKTTFVKRAPGTDLFFACGFYK